MNKIDKPLQEVWDVKDKIYEEVKHLKPEEQINAVVKKAEETCARLGYKIEKPSTLAR